MNSDTDAAHEIVEFPFLTDKRIDLNELMARLHSAHDRPGLDDETRSAVSDAIALFLQLGLIARRKGLSRDKGLEILAHLGMLRAKEDLRKHRDNVACELIALDLSYSGKKILSQRLKDELGQLMGMPGDPSGISKIWQSRSKDISESVPTGMTKAQFKRYREDLAIVISDLTKELL